MKKKIILLFTGWLISAVITEHAFAQRAEVKTMAFINEEPLMVNANIMRSFLQSFQDAEDPIWYELDKNFLVKFSKDDAKHHALYRKKGYMVYHIMYGNEKHLPADVRKTVKSSYYDYTITRVSNVKEDGRNIWVINLEDARDFIIVRVEDGEMEEVKKFTKA